ncbi:Hypothetical protein, putative [Bodo saltans]|uniref:Uncharacterized protein n=1 Tax=Bodo saltans TaxID=75058 RepID=A0A0S4JR27_BODSA|nr:Hypothetical protein, putative [Bodo saltans]|eukprot:CUG93972.1 Hypothetical protein, putative [Bodo saltans]
MLVDRVPWLTSANQASVSEPRRSKSFIVLQDEPLGSPLDLLAFIKEIPDFEFFSETSPSPLGGAPSSPLPPRLPTFIEVAAQQLHTTTTPWSCAVKALLSLFPASIRRRAHSTAIETLTHDNAQVMVKLFERSVPRQEIGDEQLMKDAAQIVATIRAVMREYLQLPELTEPAAGGSNHNHNHVKKPQDDMKALHQCTDLVQRQDIADVVSHVLGTVPAHKAERKSASMRLELHTLLSPTANTEPLHCAFGMGGGDVAPMPSRVQRFLAVAAAALEKTENTAVHIKLGHIAFADDWLLGALRIHGMFTVILNAAFSSATVASSVDLKRLTEPSDASTVPALLGRLLRFSLMTLQQLLPAEQSDAIHVREALLATQLGTSGDPLRYINLVQDAANVSSLASTTVSSTGNNSEISFSSGSSYAFNVRIVTSRVFAQHVVTMMHAHRDILFNFSRSDSLLKPFDHSQTFSISSASVFDSSVSFTRSVRSSMYDSMVHLLSLPLGALLWIGSRTFCELDAVDILFSAPRVQAFGWLAAVVSSSATHDTQPVSYLADQPWWPALADSIVTPVEDVLYFRTRPCAKVFHVKGAPPQAMRELLNAFLSRAAATGDCTLLQRAFAAKDGVEIMHPQRPEAPLGWQPGACGLTPLMLAILCGQRPVVEFLVQWARTLKSGKALLQTCVTGLSPLATPADGIDSMWISRRIGDTEATMSLVGALELMMAPSI